MSRIFILVIATLLFSTCSDNAQEKQQLITEIEILETEIYDESTSTLQVDKIETLILAYISYVDTYPNDSLAPEYLFLAAERARNVNKADMSIEYYTRVRSNYPDYEKAPLSLFLIGFITDNLLNNLSDAKKIYIEFIQKYPDHEFVESANQLVELIDDPSKLDQIIGSKEDSTITVQK